MIPTNHIWNCTVSTVYYLNKGEKIPRHKHHVEHTTSVLIGMTQVEIYDDRPLIHRTKEDGVLILPANIDHEIRALTDNTIVLNMMESNAVTYSPDPNPVSGTDGGVMLVDI